MANGMLAKVALSANTNTPVYTVPASTFSTVTVNVCNTGPIDIYINISVGAASPAASDYINYGVFVPVGGSFERTGVVCSAGNVIVCKSTGGASVQVYGFEESV